MQLAGGHIDSHVNNPSESIGQWKGSTQRPLCAFSPQRLPDGPKVTATQNWHDIPTCVEAGLDIPQFQQPRTVWLPGKVTADQAAFYVDLMKKVQATPEWKEYIERTSQTDTFLTGDAFNKFIKEDIERTRKIAAEQGWLVPTRVGFAMVSRRSLEAATALSPGRSAPPSSSPASTTASAGRAAGVDAGTFPFIVGLIIAGAAACSTSCRDGCTRATVIARADRAQAVGNAVRPGRDLCRRHSADRDVRPASAIYVFGALRLAQARLHRCVRPSLRSSRRWRSI